MRTFVAPQSSNNFGQPIRGSNPKSIYSMFKSNVKVKKPFVLTNPKDIVNLSCNDYDYPTHKN